MTDAETAWLAGLLEGEGSFMRRVAANGRGKRYAYPRIQISMMDYDIVARVATVFGVRPQRKPKRGNQTRDVWTATVTGSKAAEVMTDLRPWMGERRGAKIDELLTDTNTTGDSK